MFKKKIGFHIIALFIITFIFSKTSLSDCEDNCDFPWPAKCVEYCTNQKVALRVRCFSNAPIYIAWRKGFFRRTGLDTSVAYYGESDNVIHRIINHKGKKIRPFFGLVSADIALRSIEQGSPIKIIMGIEGSPPLVLMGREKVTDVYDLKFATIGVPANQSLLFAINDAFRERGLKIYTRPIKMFELYETLSTGRLDYGFIPFSYEPKLEKQGFVTSFSLSKIIPAYLTSTIIINEENKDKYQVDYKNFSTALLRALNFFYENKQGTLDILEKELAPTGATRQDLNTAYDFYKSNNIFIKDGTISFEAFNALLPQLRFGDAIDLSYIK